MNEISKEQLLYMKRTRQHKQFVLFFQLFLFIFFILICCKWIYIRYCYKIYSMITIYSN